MLALAPTSIGKTQIGIWALASWLAADRARRRTVYLVTHRSLANQKFEEFQRILLEPLFSNALDSMVLATGDRTVDASGASVDSAHSTLDSWLRHTRNSWVFYVIVGFRETSTTHVSLPTKYKFLAINFAV